MCKYDIKIEKVEFKDFKFGFIHFLITYRDSDGSYTGLFDKKSHVVFNLKKLGAAYERDLIGVMGCTAFSTAQQWTYGVTTDSKDIINDIYTEMFDSLLDMYNCCIKNDLYSKDKINDMLYGLSDNMTISAYRKIKTFEDFISWQIKMTEDFGVFAKTKKFNPASKTFK